MHADRFKPLAAAGFSTAGYDFDAIAGMPLNGIVHHDGRVNGRCVNASRPAPRRPAPAPRPRRCRRAGCAARARAAPRWAARSSAARSSSAKPPSGPISTASGGGRCRRPRRAAASAATGSFTSASSSQNTSRRVGLALGQHAVEAERGGDLRQRQDAALLGGLDRIGPHPLEIDARDLGVPREHRLQARGAHLDRLLHHVVEPRMLERGEQVMQVERRGLRAGLFADARATARVFRRLPGVARHSPSRPLNTSTGAPAFEPQHIAQVVRLRRVERERLRRPRAGRRHRASGCGNRSAAWRVLGSLGVASTGGRTGAAEFQD